ncbi:SDR family oxidoreductase [Rhodobacteraceae bacterium]|nr:SDR family oxidoreductase [Paracoccaceae bacterium]
MRAQRGRDRQCAPLPSLAPRPALCHNTAQFTPEPERWRIVTAAHITQLALITGASRGLGAAFALELARKGFHIMAVARQSGGLEALDDRIVEAGGRATLAPMDICDPAHRQHLSDAIMARWGGLSLWVHCAINAPPLTPAAHIVEKDMARALATNLSATAALIAHLEPLLRARAGRAVFFDDPACAGAKFFGSYGATKAAQIALVRSWATESARIGPDVRILHPRPMRGALRARFFPGEDRAALTSPQNEAHRLLERVRGP